MKLKKRITAIVLATTMSIGMIGATKASADTDVGELLGGLFALGIVDELTGGAVTEQFERDVANAFFRGITEEKIPTADRYAPYYYSKENLDFDTIEWSCKGLGFKYLGSEEWENLSDEDGATFVGKYEENVIEGIMTIVGQDPSIVTVDRIAYELKKCDGYTVFKVQPLNGMEAVAIEVSAKAMGIDQLVGDKSLFGLAFPAPNNPYYMVMMLAVSSTGGNEIPLKCLYTLSEI